MPWAPGVKEYLVRIPLTIVTGRWLVGREPVGASADVGPVEEAAGAPVQESAVDATIGVGM